MLYTQDSGPCTARLNLVHAVQCTMVDVWRHVCMCTCTGQSDTGYSVGMKALIAHHCKAFHTPLIITISKGLARPSNTDRLGQAFDVLGVLCNSNGCYQMVASCMGSHWDSGVRKAHRLPHTHTLTHSHTHSHTHTHTLTMG